MKPATLPANEVERLRALSEYSVLDTPCEPEFDDLTRLASFICETPIALISLVDQDRQWFKSRVGVGEEITQTPREISFCAHALHGPETFIVDNPQTDPRFADNPLVTGDTQIRFYAGVPLVTPAGHAVGTLCVIDQKTRGLTAAQDAALRSLARQVVSLLELRKSHQMLGQKFQELQDLSKVMGQQQTMLFHSAKLASLGEMAGGLAHEINNPLAIIAGKVGQLRERIRKGTVTSVQAEQDIETVERTAFRIAKIVKGLRSFAREDGSEARRTASLHDIIQDTAALTIERIKNRGITIELPADQGFQTLCRPVEIEQILVNLLYNASDAVACQSSKWIRIEVLPLGQPGLVQLAVSNSGPVIPIELHQKIFEPFFTTKPIGQGVGLGLSIARGLALSNGGDLTLNPSPEGTTFVLSLSLAVEARS